MAAREGIKKYINREVPFMKNWNKQRRLRPGHLLDQVGILLVQTFGPRSDRGRSDKFRKHRNKSNKATEAMNSLLEKDRDAWVSQDDFKKMTNKQLIAILLLSCQRDDPPIT